jgi:hypothetical protein
MRSLLGRVVAYREGEDPRDVFEQLQAEEEREFDSRLVEAVLAHAARAGELVMGEDDLLWLLGRIGTLDALVRDGRDLEGLTIMTPGGAVRVVVI